MERENKILKVLVIILGVLLLGVIGYFVYSQIDDITENKSVVEDTEKNIADNVTNDNGDTSNTATIDETRIESTDFGKLNRTLGEKFKFVFDYYNATVMYCGSSKVSDKKNDKGVFYYESTDFASYDEMINYLKTYMTISVIDGKRTANVNEKRFYVEENGKLYCQSLGKGGGFLTEMGGVDKYNMQINSLTDIKAETTFDVLISFTDAGVTYYSYKVINVTFEKTNNNWLVTSFDIE